jgi:hypothetical protein
VKSGDYLVCVTKDMTIFTYGKKYKLMSDATKEDNLIDLIDDNGVRPLPSQFFTQGGKKKYYFITIDEWRRKQIEKLL